MEFARLRLGEVVASVGAFVFLILLFFPWFSISINGGVSDFGSFGIDADISGWDTVGWFVGLIFFVTIVFVLGTAFLQMADRTVALPLTAAVISAVLSVISLLFVLFQFIDKPGYGADGAFGLSVDPTIWYFVAILTTLAMIAGSWMSMREDGATQQFPGGGTGGGTPQPPAAPHQPVPPQQPGFTPGAPVPPASSQPPAGSPPPIGQPPEPPAAA